MEEDPARALVKRRLAEIEMTLRDASVKIGRNTSYLQQYLERHTPRSLPEEAREKLAALIGVDPEELRSPVDTKARGGVTLPSLSVTAAPSNVDASSIRTRGLVGDADLPVYGAAQGGPGVMIVTNEPIEYVRRPEPLMGVADGFAVYLIGSSMEPRFRHGEMALVHPSRPARPGDDVLVVTETRGNEQHCMVKELVKVNEHRAVLRQYNPEKEWEIDLSGVRIMQIVGSYRGR